MITVFYDGKCGLCRAEIEHYIKIVPIGVFNWQDITINSNALATLGIEYADGLRLLHAQDGQGKLHIGVNAFILIWNHIHYWQIAAKIVSLPFIYPIIKFAYTKFAAWRFNRLEHCKIALEK